MKKPAVSDAVMVQERKEGLTLISSMRPLINNLIVKSEADYIKADNLLSRIREGRLTWKQRMAKILDPLKETVTSAKKAYASADSLYDEIDGPMADIELGIKERMRAFKLEERRLLQEAEEKRLRDEQELQKQLRAKEEAEAKAKTPAMARSIIDAKAKLQQALANKRAEEAPEPVRAESSQARVSKKWRVTDMQALINSLLSTEEEHELLGLVQIDRTQMEAYFKLQQPKLGEWLPGVMVEEDIIIAGRRQ